MSPWAASLRADDAQSLHDQLKGQQAFLIWRVWRGGVLAWAALLTLNGWSALIWGAAFVVQLHGESGMAGHETGSASPYLLGLLGFSIAALVLLTSPAIRARTAHAQRAVADG